MKITLNIGLNNNPKDMVEMVNFLYDNGINLMDFKRGVGKWEGADEPTFVAICDTGLNLIEVLLVVEDMCKFCTQECIAVMIMDVGNSSILSDGYLIYDSDYEGAKMVFDHKYFIRLN